MKMLFCSIFASMCCGCTPSTLLDSGDQDQIEKRIRTLKAEIVSASEFEDAEYKLFNVNGFSEGFFTVPGASSWDYQFALKVKTTDLDKWTTEMVRVDSLHYDDSWTKELVKKRNKNWMTSSPKEMYIRKEGGTVLILYRKEGLLFKRITAL